jgi:hypothetical protein|tara:strand:- start:806 stop:1003 length:198 start_codon:yes stop_codon:yes gene_type:complete
MNNPVPTYDGYNAIVNRLSGDIKSEIKALGVHDTIKEGLLTIVDRLGDNLTTEIEEIISGREEGA